jgi:hypothetical protein
MERFYVGPLLAGGDYELSNFTGVGWEVIIEQLATADA